jgi:hypothetical protein
LWTTRADEAAAASRRAQAGVLAVVLAGALLDESDELLEDEPDDAAEEPFEPADDELDSLEDEDADVSAFDSDLLLPADLRDSERLSVR